ncbi:MAG TPA: AAA family ATPase, partial [Verrucomicrobiae bacterium]|nr:AAA family ATPase [Verrucomicrobiae bacterium]
MNWAGTRWFKGDFHVHTPFSHCYRQHGVSAQDFFARVKDLDFVVVADHNTFDGYLHLLEYQVSGTVLFPGIELKVPSGYGGLSLVAILDPQHSPEILETFVREIGLSTAEKGDNRVLVQKSLPEILRIIDKYHGIVLWTKVFSPEGLIGGLDAPQREYVLKLSGNNGILDLGPEGGAMPGVWGSNAHSLAEISALSMIKLEQLNFAALKFALQDLQGRVRPGVTPVKLNYPRILSLQVTGGFLNNQVFEFNPGLNCLIGARGTGKSTALRLLSFALGTDVKPAELGALVEVQVNLVDSGGELLRVKRRPGQKPRVQDIYGRLLERDIKGLAVFFAQGEIEQVVLRPEFQLELLDSTWDSAGLIADRERFWLALQANNRRLAELG